MSESNPARNESNKKRPPASRSRAEAREHLAIVDVPADPYALKRALLLLQPLWARIGGHVIIFCAAACVLVVWDPLQHMPRIIFRLVGGAAAALILGVYMYLRELALRGQVGLLLRGTSDTGYSRIELDEDGLVYRGGLVPWSDVSDAVEVDHAEATLLEHRMLAVRAHGSWIILPASCFKHGDFNGARSLLMRKIGDKLRILVQ